MVHSRQFENVYNTYVDPVLDLFDSEGGALAEPAGAQQQPAPEAVRQSQHPPLPARAVLPQPMVARPAPPPAIPRAPEEPRFLQIVPDERRADEYHRVKRVFADKRAKYFVTLGPCMYRRGDPLDTEQIKVGFIAKRNPRVAEAYKEIFPLKQHDPVKARAPIPVVRDPKMTQQQQGEWYLKSMIWVCARDPITGVPSFYTHVCKFHSFHHSSMAPEEGVIAAGEWIVKAGMLLKVNGHSGHYKPSIRDLQRAMRQMAPAVNQRTLVLLYDKEQQQYIYTPAMQFILLEGDRMISSGRYKAHPDER